MSHESHHGQPAENKSIVSFKNSFWLVIILVGLFIAAINFVQVESAGSGEGHHGAEASHNGHEAATGHENKHEDAAPAHEAAPAPEAAGSEAAKPAEEGHTDEHKTEGK